MPIQFKLQAFSLNLEILLISSMSFPVLFDGLSRLGFICMSITYMYM